MNVDEVRAALTGPLMSIRTSFNRDGSVDYAGVKRMVDFAIEAGSRTSLLTAGDSHYQLLSDAEMAELSQVVTEHTAGRAMVVACDWDFATPQAVDFARFLKDIGADIYMVRPPDWANSSLPQGLVDHYAAVADVMPVMVVTNIFKERSVGWSMDVLAKVRDTVPNVLAIKEDLTNDFARRMCMLVHDKWAVFAGGGLRNHLNMHPYGCDGFMDRFMNFKPAVSYRYWNAVREGDTAEAVKVIDEIELPLELFMDSFPGGRDAAIHGLLEIYGIAGRWRRAPYHSLTDAEMKKLEAKVREMGLL